MKINKKTILITLIVIITMSITAFKAYSFYLPPWFSTGTDNMLKYISTLCYEDANCGEDMLRCNGQCVAKCFDTDGNYVDEGDSPNIDQFTTPGQVTSYKQNPYTKTWTNAKEIDSCKTKKLVAEQTCQRVKVFRKRHYTTKFKGYDYVRKTQYKSCSQIDEGFICKKGKVTGTETNAGYCGKPECATDEDCNDGNACNGEETCENYICQPGTAPILDDNDICTVDSCDPTLGITHIPVDVDDNNVCTVDSCDPELGVVNAPLWIFVTLLPPFIDNHANKCVNYVCDPIEGLKKIETDVDDGDPCTEDSCDPETGFISHEILETTPDGETCAPCIDDRDDCWKPVGGGPKNCNLDEVTSFAYFEGYRYAAVSSLFKDTKDGVYRLEGDVWVDASNGLPEKASVIQLEIYNQRLYAVVYDEDSSSYKHRIFRLEHTGDEWKEVPLPDITYTNLMTLLPHGNSLIAGNVSPDGVWRTYGEDQPWEKVGANNIKNVQSLHVHKNYLYAGIIASPAEGGLYKLNLDEESAEWEIVPGIDASVHSFLSYGDILLIGTDEYYPQSPKIYRSDDGENSFHLKHIASNCIRIDEFHSHNGVLYASLHSTTLLKSLDLGNSWEPVFDYDAWDPSNQTYAFYSHNDKLHIGTQTGVFEYTCELEEPNYHICDLDQDGFIADEQIPDLNLRKAIKDGLGIAQNELIPTDMAENMEFLLHQGTFEFVDPNEITDLTGLQLISMTALPLPLHMSG